MLLIKTTMVNSPPTLRITFNYFLLAQKDREKTWRKSGPEAENLVGKSSGVQLENLDFSGPFRLKLGTWNGQFMPWRSP